jgi:tetratricopeptide (TPR) repeat protein
MSAEQSGPSEPLHRSLHKGLLAVPGRYADYARLAGALRLAADAPAAAVALQRARLLCPGDPRLYVNSANLWLTAALQGNPVRALWRALCLDPSFTAASDQLLLLQRAVGDTAAAMRSARRGVCREFGTRSRPLLELALLVFEAGDQDQAIKILKSAVPEAIRSPEGLGWLFTLARRVEATDLSAWITRIALCLSPMCSVAARELANISSLLDADGPTRHVLARMSLVLPVDSVVLNASGVLLERRHLIKEALSCYIRASILDPSLSMATFNVGVQSRYAGDFTRAALLFERALIVRFGNPIYQYNLGLVLLATGHTDRGLALYEERWRSGERSSQRRAGPAPSFDLPFWDGCPVNSGDSPDINSGDNTTDCSVLVWGEQGVGDEIWFAGYLPRLLVGRKAVLECDGRLTGLFKRSELAGTVVARTDPPHRDAARAKYQTAAGSLPYLAGRSSSLMPLPAPCGYLRPDPVRAADLQSRLAAITDGPTIGLSWRSTKSAPGRSFEAPLAEWGPLLAQSGATFVSLQYGVDLGELRQVRNLFGVNVVTFEDIDPLQDIDGLTALISVLDHVVSVANVTVAMCHGLGHSCHVALRPYQDDWRFQRNSAKSSWLPTCSMYWPNQDSGWGGVFTEIAKDLKIPSPG